MHERPPVTLQLCGRFALAVDGHVRPDGGWRSRRAAELVQLLALEPGLSLPHEQAIEALWPHLDPAAGSANLRKAAHLARQSLGEDDAVVLRSGRVGLFPDRAVTSDAHAFEQAADDALARPDAPRCAAAARLYGGDLLPDLRFEAWAAGPRQRLRDKFLRLLRAAQDWERLAQEDPGDEPAHQALMQQALAAGSPATALQCYARLRAHLEQALGVRPGAQTEALYRACLAGLQPRGPAFVGRAAELARAHAWLAAALTASQQAASSRASAADGVSAMATAEAPAAAPHRRAAALVIRGPAGIGKTRFARRLAADARAGGWHVVQIAADGADRAFGVVTDLVDDLVALAPAALETVGTHARAVLAALTASAGPAQALPGPLTRHQVIGAVRRLLLATAPGQPVLLLADDLQAADDGSRETLLQLAAAGPPLALVLTCRTEAGTAPAREIERLRRGGQAELIELGPLPDGEIEQLVAQVAGRPLDGARAGRLRALCGGHPFAAVELARALAEDPAAADGGQPGAGAAAAIAARLGSVDASAQAGLQRLAIVGEACTPTTAVALADPDPARACALLDEALAAGLLQVADGRYRFRHELIREALVDAVAPHQRLALHRAVAATLATLEVEPGLVARHWLAAGDAEQAQPWCLAAARQAQRLGAYADVRRLIEPLLAQRPDHPEALALKADALDALADPGTLAAYAAAAAVAPPDLAHELRAKRALAQVKMSDPQGALASLVGVHPTSVAGRVAEALAYSGAAALGFGDPAIGTAKAAECRRVALESGDTGALVIASWAHAAAAHARGELHGSVWADLQETHQLPHLAVRVFDGHLCITQRFLYGSRPYPEVIAFADALAAEARRLGAARGQAFAVTLRGEARLLSGDLDGAEQDLRDGGRLHRAIHGATGEALSLQRRAELALLRGQRHEARDLLDDALDVARQSDVGFHLLDRIYGTRIALAADAEAGLAALEEADHAVRGPFETCPGCRITFAVPATIAAARARALDLAGQHEHQAAYLANVVMKLPAWHAALHEARGHIARAGGDEPGARQRFAHAAAGFRGAGQPMDELRCRRLAAGEDG